MKIIVLTLVSWAAGVAALLLSYAALSGEVFSGTYLGKILLCSLIVALVAFPVVYLPCMFLLRWVLHGCTRVLWFPVVASLLGIIPMFLLAVTSGQPSEVLSPEAFVHYSIITAAGVVFGLGFVRFYGRAAKT